MLVPASRWWVGRGIIYGETFFLPICGVGHVENEAVTPPDVLRKKLTVWFRQRLHVSVAVGLTTSQLLRGGPIRDCTSNEHNLDRCKAGKGLATSWLSLLMISTYAAVAAKMSIVSAKVQ